MNFPYRQQRRKHDGDIDGVADHADASRFDPFLPLQNAPDDSHGRRDEREHHIAVNRIEDQFHRETRVAGDMKQIPHQPDQCDDDIENEKFDRYAFGHF